MTAGRDMMMLPVMGRLRVGVATGGVALAGAPEPRGTVGERGRWVPGAGRTTWAGGFCDGVRVRGSVGPEPCDPKGAVAAGFAGVTGAALTSERGAAMVGAPGAALTGALGAALTGALGAALGARIGAEGEGAAAMAGAAGTATGAGRAASLAARPAATLGSNAGICG
jgi:hypothetical protein